MSQYLGYRIFNEAGSPAPRCAFARVTVNGEHLGVYSHVETIRKPLLKRAFGWSLGTLFEGTIVDFDPGWEGSLELKTGDEAVGRAKLVALIEALQMNAGEPLFPASTGARAWVPDSADDDRRWMKAGFDDTSWVRGRGGAGYERGQGYGDLIYPSFDFGALLYNRATSLYLRLPFELASDYELENQGQLVLRVRYDDGFGEDSRCIGSETLSIARCS